MNAPSGSSRRATAGPRPVTLGYMADDSHQSGEITHLLGIVRAGPGAHDAEARVVQLAYEEMRRIAGSLMDRRPEGTISATALVHEAWLKLNGNLGGVTDRCHFLALAARAMRQVMADAARARSALKRGGDQPMYTLCEHDAATGSPEIDLADLHDVLAGFRNAYPRQADVFELRAFGTLTFAEIGDLLGISESSARMDWKFGRAWLRTSLSAPNEPGTH